MKKLSLLLLCLLLCIGCSSKSNNKSKTKATTEPEKVVEAVIFAFKDLDSDAAYPYFEQPATDSRSIGVLQETLDAQPKETSEGMKLIFDYLLDFDYTFKDTAINGDTAVVTVEIAAYDMNIIASKNDSPFDTKDPIKTIKGFFVDETKDYQDTIKVDLIKVDDEWKINKNSLFLINLLEIFLH